MSKAQADKAVNDDTTGDKKESTEKAKSGAPEIFRSSEDTVGFTIFTRAEFLERVRICREEMARRGMDALFVTDPANMHYLTGYDSWSFYVPQCVLVMQDEEEPTWIGRGIDANGVPATTYLGPENIYYYMDNYVHADDVHPMDYIADVLLQKDLGNKVVGLEMDCFYFSAASYRLLKQWMPNTTFKDAHFMVNWQRSIKCEKEIMLLRQAAEIMDNVMNHAIDVIEPGMRQNDLAAQIRYDQIYGTDKFGGDYTAIVPMMPSGINTGIPHLHWTDTPFEEGEPTVLELAAARHHYHCPMARTVFLGEPPHTLNEIAKVAEEGIEASLDIIKPGIRCEDMEAAFRETLAKYGYVKSSRMGYSTGLNYPPDWGEHTMSIRPGDKTVLKPGMTLHMIPGLWGNHWGVEISQTFVVTEDGYEPLGTVPRKLFVKN